MTSNRVHHLPRLGISGAMQIYGVSARALRFYEERGLVEAQRDRLNCRYYDAPARQKLDWITRLRRVNVTLPDIRHVLQAETETDRRSRAEAIVRRRQAALERELDAARSLLDDLADEHEPVASVVVGAAS